MILKTAAALVIAFLCISSAYAFSENKDYKVLPNPENIDSDVIVVREFFWYGCPHCYSLEPYMQKWANGRAKDVAFFRTPAAMNPVWEVSARGFYAAKELGYEDEVHGALFDDVHKHGKQLNSQSALADWYASYGVDKNKFNQAFNSFSVTSKIERSRQGAARYQLTGVPAVVVHGKYVVTAQESQVPAVIDFLVDKVRQEKAN